ncbi:MAG: NAD(P)H-hydrate dehydratase [Thermoguttaceae bacterium]|jgi:hydroxyethylthiazole kinase-like uncharacterized protein yjeF
METYLPDDGTNATLRRLAEEDSYGERRAFWRDVPELPARPSDAHKGNFGTALTIGGARGMTGAVGLAGIAALVAGSGLSRLAVPDAILETVASYAPEYTTIPLPCDAQGRLADAALEPALEASRQATAVAVGPGLGRSEALDKLVTELFFELDRPALFDADALNALAAAGVFTDDPRYADRFPKGERIFTPHPGEFERLSGAKPTGDERARQDASTRWLKKYVARFYGQTTNARREDRRPATLLLKGAGTVVTNLSFPQIGGHKIKQKTNATGNANLATGGSGDVLTGLILGLLCQGASCFDAARIGAAIHGLAAEIRAKIVARGALAGDVVRFIPVAFDFYAVAQSHASGRQWLRVGGRD